MTLHAYQQSVFSGSDTVAVAPFAQITVTNASDDSAASIWSDAAGTSPIADGVLLADEKGYFIFYADEGTYNIAILSDGISKTLENVEIGAGNPYSGVFKGNWDMSSGTAGPAVDDAYRATISASGDTYAIAPLTPAETVISATSTLPYGGGWCAVNNEYDLVSGTRYYTMFGFVQENVSAADITAPPTNNPCLSVLIAAATDNSYAAFIYAGDPNDGYTTTITDNQPHPTGGVAEFQCTLDGSDYVISCRFGGVASEVLRYPSAGIGAMKPIVARYYFGASTLPITGMTTGFVNATLPVGALDNDWYEVSAGGYFHGKTTRAGQFVKLISGKTDLIIVDDPTIHSATEKTIPADADEIGIVDSAASNILKKLTWANLKATLYAQLANVASGFLGIIYVDTWANCLANKPAASNSGKFIIVTDRYNGALFRSNGTCYNRVGGGPIVSNTASNINANYNPTTYDGCTAVATDLGNPGIGVELIAASGAWHVKSPGIVNLATAKLVPSNWYINCNPSGATYSQSGTTLTLTWTSHGISNSLNGANIYLAPSSGTAPSGWHSNITVVDANTITCTSTSSLTTSGNIGSNAVETYLPTIFTFPSFLIRAGIVVNISGFHWAKSGASTKSTKVYAFGNNMGSVNLTTSGQITVVGLQSYGQGMRFSTDTNFYFNTLTSILNYTVSDYTLKFSSTCATANDWHAICTEWITYSGS